jgi:DNA-directed RNA polymerase subunit H (RpoH/RPB5)
LEEEGSDTLKIGEFFFREGSWNLERHEEDILTPVLHTTEVIYLDNIQSSDYVLNSFSEVAGKILIHTGDEKNFRKELENMVWYRRQGVEIFHMTELYIDYFQHWLVPRQEILSNVEKIKALSSHLMIRGQDGKFEKVVNCHITEQSLPSIHHSDIVIRYLGALPGHIIYWENESYISSFITQESGYMLVVGHKYTPTRSEENIFAGERIPGSGDEDQDMDDDDDEVEDGEDDDGGDDGGDDYED